MPSVSPKIAKITTKVNFFKIRAVDKPVFSELLCVDVHIIFLETGGFNRTEFFLLFYFFLEFIN